MDSTFFYVGGHPLDYKTESLVGLTIMTEESQLIARCCAGSSTAWDELFDRYYPVAARYVFQLSPDFTHEDTEEICQETFLAVIRNITSFKGGSAFQTWILRIASNKAKDFRDKTYAVKRGGGIAFIPINTDESSDDAPVNPRSSTPGPDHALLAREKFTLLRQSLDQLDTPCREVIELRYYGDLSYDEIAAELSLNPKTVSSRLSKCMAKLAVIARDILPEADVYSV